MLWVIKNRVHADPGEEGHGVIHHYFARPARAAASSSPRWSFVMRRGGDLQESLMALIEDFDREIADTTREIEQRARATTRRPSPRCALPDPRLFGATPPC